MEEGAHHKVVRPGRQSRILKVVPQFLPSRHHHLKGSAIRNVVAAINDQVGKAAYFKA